MIKTLAFLGTRSRTNMPLQLSQIDLSQAYQGSIANREVQKSFAKISSGKKLVNATDDTAAYAQSRRMESQQESEIQIICITCKI